MRKGVIQYKPAPPAQWNLFFRLFHRGEIMFAFYLTGVNDVPQITTRAQGAPAVYPLVSPPADKVFCPCLSVPVEKAQRTGG